MNPGTVQPVLSVQDLCITFPVGTRRVTVVDRLSFDLAAGEIVGLVGESGCGKSMTGAALLGMVPSPAGQVTTRNLQLEDRNLAALDEAGWRKIRGHQISMIFQEPLSALDPVFSIGSQLCEVIRRHRRYGRKAAHELSAKMLVSVGLSECERIMRSYPHELSGGMRQRVMIAMAMSCSPRLLVADEPTTALDVTTQATILQQIRTMARDAGTAVLLITHDLGVVAQTCDRAMVMYCGRLVEQGPVESLFSQPRHPYTAGLLAALPVLTKNAPVKPVETIPGSVPRLVELPSGCHFNNRCTRANQQCQVQVPRLRFDDQPSFSTRSLTRYACHHPLEAIGK